MFLRDELKGCNRLNLTHGGMLEYRRNKDSFNYWRRMVDPRRKIKNTNSNKINMKNQTKWLIGVVVVVVFSAGAISEQIRIYLKFYSRWRKGGLPVVPKLRNV